MGDPSPADWSRVQRYASWMHEVKLDRLLLGEDTLPKLRLNSPAGGWFPALQELLWRTEESNISYVDLFISPYLKVISIYSPCSWGYCDFGVPQYSSGHHSDHLCVTGLHPSTPKRRHQLRHPSDAPELSRRHALFRRSALWTITYGVRLLKPIVRCGDKPSDPSSPPQWLVYRTSSSKLLSFIIATCFPVPNYTYPLGRHCTGMAFPHRNLGGPRSHYARRDIFV